MTIFTVVYAIAADEIAQVFIETLKTKAALLDESDVKIVACCQGDAMAERDELMREGDAYNAVISYMLGKGSMQEPMEFLRLWNEGDFDSLRKEWPDAPAEIYFADPLA